MIQVLLFTVLLHFAALSQPTVHWGKPIPITKRSNMKEIIGSDSKGFYSMRIQYEGRNDYPYIERYDNHLERIMSEELILPSSQGRELKFEGIFYLGGELLLFASAYDRDTKENYAFAHKVSFKGKVSKEAIPIDTIQARKNKNIGSFDFVISNDSSKILVHSQEPYDKKGQEKFSYKVLNRDLDLLWDKDIELEYKENMFAVKDYKVDNDGNVYMLEKIYKDRKSREKNSPNHRFSILAYFHKQDLFKEYDIALEGKFISDITFKLDADQNLVCAGFYSETASNSLKGTFFLRIDGRSKQIIASGTKEFGKDVLGHFMSSKKAEKGKQELWSFKLRDFVLRGDGGAVIMAEQSYVQNVSQTDPLTGYTTTTSYYHYNEILAINVNPDASIAWITVIPKKQVTAADRGRYLSYALSVVKDKIYLLYNDNPFNLSERKRSRVRYMQNPRSALATLVTLNSSGEYRKDPLFKNKSQDIILKPKLAQQISRNELLIFGEGRDSFKFGVVRF